jgi:hypothetical protein
MSVDQKISELPIASAIGNSDAGLLVSNGADYQFAMSLLLQYVSSNLNTGAQFIFGTVLPQNTSGKNGDVYLDTTDGTIAQKRFGSWTIVYSPPAQPVRLSGNTTLYGLSTPATTIGTDGDSYINTANGIFYQKSAGVWSQVFSMQSGPAGPAGAKGEPGIPGSNGNSLLNGGTNPSNQTTGKDGDFYLNTSTYALFGPKSNGVWGDGIILIQTLPLPAVIDLPVGSSIPIIIANYQAGYADYSDYPTLIIQEVTDANAVRERTDIQPVRQFKNGRLDSIELDVPGDTGNGLLYHLQLIIKT